MMRYLLDSQIIYWLRFGNPRIPQSVYNLLEDDETQIYYSVVTPWEFSIKNAKGKLPLPDKFFTELSVLGFDCLPVEERHVNALRRLPEYHSDPFDRMLISQALGDNMTLITADRHLAAYPIRTLLV